MIIKTHKKLPTGLVDMREEGDHIKFTHVYDVTPVLEQTYADRQESLGKTRSLIGDKWEKIASVPPVVFAQHPEFQKDTKALIKWLKKKKEEGENYFVSNRNI